MTKFWPLLLLAACEATPPAPAPTPSTTAQPASSKTLETYASTVLEHDRLLKEVAETKKQLRERQKIHHVIVRGLRKRAELAGQPPPPQTVGVDAGRPHPDDLILLESYARAIWNEHQMGSEHPATRFAAQLAEQFNTELRGVWKALYGAEELYHACFVAKDHSLGKVLLDCSGNQRCHIMRLPEDRALIELNDPAFCEIRGSAGKL